MEFDRRRFLRIGSAAALGGLAGCTTDQNGTDTETSGGSTPTGGAGSTPGGSMSTPTGGQPPGADVLGGPNDLKSSATVDATVLDSDRGAGTYVNTPAVVWIESGGTVTWKIKGGAHSVTAYHPDNDRSLRIPEGASSFDSGVLSSGKTFEHTFEDAGVYNYFCRPHEGLGMVGLVIVGGPQGGPGTQPPGGEIPSAASQKLTRLLQVAGIGDGGGGQATYDWQAATWDSYWYSLYNMSTTISMSGVGVTFPHNAQQRETFKQRKQAMLKRADVEKPPVVKPNLNMAPFTSGDPHFTQRPVFDAGDGRPDASTLAWDRSKMSKVVSPSSLAWTHLKGVTWAKNFQEHFDVLPTGIAPKFRAQVLATLAQLGVKFALVDGNLRKNDDNMLLVSGWHPKKGVVDGTPRPQHHSAMLWFLSDLVSLAENGWFGYVNPKPLIPANKLQMMLDGVAKTTMNAFGPSDVVSAGSARDLGEFLGAMGWYGTHAGSDALRSKAADYANDLAAAVESRMDGDGRVQNGAANQAATQGAVVQGLLWASQVDGVDHAGTAESALDYLLETLWDETAGTFASGANDSTYTITARDAADVTGAVNAADAVLGRSEVQSTYARFYNQTFNRGRLQRAERPPSRDTESEYPLPLPPKAGGQYGQAAVYNTAVEYDTAGESWQVTESRFHTDQALYLANQDIWLGQWGGDFFSGRGVPGRTDDPPE